MQPKVQEPLGGFVRGSVYVDFSGEKVISCYQMLKGIPNQERSRTLTGLQGLPSKLSPVSVTAVITSGGMEPGEKELF